MEKYSKGFPEAPTEGKAVIRIIDLVIKIEDQQAMIYNAIKEIDARIYGDSPNSDCKGVEQVSGCYHYLKKISEENEKSLKLLNEIIQRL